MVKQHTFKGGDSTFSTLDSKLFLDAYDAFGIGPNSSAKVSLKTTITKIIHNDVSRGYETTTSISSTVNGKVVYLGVSSMVDGNIVVFDDESKLNTTRWNIYPYKIKDANGKSKTVYGAFLYNAPPPGLNLALSGSNLIVQKDPVVDWNIINLNH